MSELQTAMCSRARTRVLIETMMKRNGGRDTWLDLTNWLPTRRGGVADSRPARGTWRRENRKVGASTPPLVTLDDLPPARVMAQAALLVLQTSTLSYAHTRPEVGFCDVERPTGIEPA